MREYAKNEYNIEVANSCIEVLVNNVSCVEVLVNNVSCVEVLVIM